MVTYSIFLQSYWPHFPQSLTKGLGIFLKSPMLSHIPPSDMYACRPIFSVQ